MSLHFGLFAESEQQWRLCCAQHAFAQRFGKVVSVSVAALHYNTGFLEPGAGEEVCYSSPGGVEGGGEREGTSW